MPAEESTDILKHLSETYRSVRLGRGVVGKTGQAMLGLLGIWAIVVWQLSDSVTRDIALVAAAIIATGAFWWWTKSTQQFAKENPARVLLEGAELLEYQKFEAQIKGFSSIPESSRISDPSKSTPPVIDVPVRPNSDEAE
jgi:hypothetical protein